MTDALVLLHAFPMDASMWEPQVSALSGRTAIVAPNFPGFGGAALGGTSVSMDDAAEVAASDLSAAGAGRAVVGGLSMGGYVALAFLRRYRDPVAGLVLAHTR